MEDRNTGLRGRENIRIIDNTIEERGKARREEGRRQREVNGD